MGEYLINTVEANILKSSAYYSSSIIQLPTLQMEQSLPSWSKQRVIICIPAEENPELYKDISCPHGDACPEVRIESNLKLDDGYVVLKTRIICDPAVVR